MRAAGLSAFQTENQRGGEPTGSAKERRERRSSVACTAEGSATGDSS